MRQHVRLVHIALRTIQCDMCPLAFKRKSDLKKHTLNMHNPEHPKTEQPTKARSSPKNL